MYRYTLKHCYHKNGNNVIMVKCFYSWSSWVKQNQVYFHNTLREFWVEAMILLLMWINMLNHLALLTEYYDVINNSYVTWLVTANWKWVFGSDPTDWWATLCHYEASHSVWVWGLKIWMLSIMNAIPTFFCWKHIILWHLGLYVLNYFCLKLQCID